ncbi:hypothetical protein GCM10010191_57720 [Actinomadura vinacea]|uniref:Protein kinase domain-containing protein n=1 Tax=Actinomadura vinacea TaxID=115336 RepID=A0ABN3JNE3_9ACTN
MTDRTMPETRPLRPGDPTVLGAYELLGRLGEGGQGAVFLGRPADAGEPDDPVDRVAIKLLHSGLTGDDSARARFVRELDVAKRVARFCTAQVLDADLAGDQPYIVSEFVPGLSLQRLVQAEGPRSGGALERLAISTLTALFAIHQAGIVHRDFKPHNVMMGPDGPRVIDFGVARALGAAGETQNVGTPSYMAPEHFSGGAVGPAADMFAWGTTMVFAASGRPAFGNDDMAAVMHRILTEEPDLGDLPSPLREVVAACLTKEPERRPTAREAQERLVDAASGLEPGVDDTQHAPDVPAWLEPALSAGAPKPEGEQAVQGTTAPEPPPHGGAPMPVHAPSVQQHPPSPYPQITQPHVPASKKDGRKRLVVPIAAAAAVAALLAGGSVWAATRGGDKDPGQTTASEQGGRENGPVPIEGLPGAPDRQGKDKTKPQNSQDPSAKPGQKSQKPGGQPSKPPALPGGGGGGGSSRPEPPNRYSSQQVCNSGGHGGGYYVQRSMAVAGGTAYQLYNSSGYNCAVMIKSTNVGRESAVSVWIQRTGGSKVPDSGSYAWYAGPVYVKAPGECVRFGSGSSTSSYANCG